MKILAAIIGILLASSVVDADPISLCRHADGTMEFGTDVRPEPDCKGKASVPGLRGMVSRGVLSVVYSWPDMKDFSALRDRVKTFETDVSKLKDDVQARLDKQHDEFMKDIDNLATFVATNDNAARAVANALVKQKPAEIVRAITSDKQALAILKSALAAQ